MSSRLIVAAGADGRFHQVHRYPQGIRHVRGEDPGRADRRRLLVGLLEISAAERGQRARVVGGQPSLDNPARESPADDLAGQLLDRVAVAARGRQQGLQFLGHPGPQGIAVGPGRLEAFAGQALGIVPPA